MATKSLRPTRLPALLGALALVFGVTACQSDTEKLDGFMARGDEYREAEQYDEAIIEYRNALQIDPNHADAHEGLAEAYLNTEQLSEGYWELGETIRLDPENIDARLSYAALSLAAKRLDEVLEQSEAIVAMDPERAAGQLMLGQAYLGLDRSDEAEAPFRRAIELEPDDGGYRMLVGAYYGSRGDLDEAEKHFRAGVERDPSPGLWSMLGRLLLDRERSDEAEQAFLSALDQAYVEAGEAGPDEPEPIEVSQAYQNLASFYFQQDQPDRGVETLKLGIEKAQNRSELISLLSRYYRSQGDDEAANDLMVAATELDPTDPMPFLTVSNLRGQEGDLEGAFEYAEKALAADPTHVKARLRKAEVLIDLGVSGEDTGRIAEGRALVEEVLAEDATNPDGLFVLSKIEIASGNADAGIEAVRAALDGRPNWPQGHFILGSALILKGEKQRARAELARSVELEPALTDARRMLVQIHADLGEHEYAIENGRSYLRARPDDDRTRIVVAQSLVRLGKVDEAMSLIGRIPEERRSVDVLFAIGRLQAAQGDLAAARAAMMAANEQQPNNARILNVLLAIDRAEGKLSHSIKRVDDAVEASPDDAELHRLRGLIGLASGNLDVAEKSLLKAIEIDPSNLSAYQTLAQLYAGTGRTSETIALYETAVEKQPENAGAHHFLGVLYEMSGDRDKARVQYEAALEYDPSLGESKNNLAYLMAETGQDLDRALKLAQEAKAAMPDSANAADTLGWVLYKRGVASAAVGYLREAVQVADKDDPTIGEIRTHLSMAYEATGDVDKAIESLEMALADLERLKESGRLRQDPPWAESARTNIDRMKSAG